MELARPCSGEDYRDFGFIIRRLVSAAHVHWIGRTQSECDDSVITRWESMLANSEPWRTLRDLVQDRLHAAGKE